MMRTGKFRVAVGGLAVVIGLLVAAPAWAGGGPSVKISSPTAGEPGYPTCTVPGHVTNKCSIGVTIKGAPASTEIAVVECNANVISGDMNACAETPGSAPGDVTIVETNAAGKAKVKDYSVLVSSKKMEGDGYCAKGDTCYIVAAVISSQAEIGTPDAFTAG
jgi:hypothetical protein